MLWKTIIGHKQTIATLNGQVQAGRVGHAYLFVGISGIGKKQVALAFASAIIAQDGNPDSDRLIANNLHPDVRRWETTKKTLGVKEIREWQKIVYLPPTSASKKMILIDDAQKMTPQAQNALLKTLEEPPLDTVFILICSNISKLLSTVVSRCRVLRFNPLSPEQLQEGMREVGVANTLYPFLTLVANGSIGQVQKLVEMLEDDDVQKLLQDIFIVLEERDSYQALKLAERLVKLDTKLDMMIYLLENIWSSALRSDGDLELIRNYNVKMLLSRSQLSLLRDCRALMQARKQFAQYQNKQLVLENLLLGLMEDKDD